MEKVTIGGKEFTMKYPSFKRTQKVSEMLKDIERIGGDWGYAKELFSVMLEGDVNSLDEAYEADTIGLGDLLEVQNRFFTMTTATLKK